MNLSLARFVPFAATGLVFIVAKSNLLRPIGYEGDIARKNRYAILLGILIRGVVYVIVWAIIGWTVATAGIVVYISIFYLQYILIDSIHPHQKIVIGLLSLVPIATYVFVNPSVVATTWMALTTLSIPEFPLFRTASIAVAVAGLLYVSTREQRRIRSEVREIQTQRRDTYLDYSYVSGLISVDEWSSQLEPSMLEIVPKTGPLAQIQSIFGREIQGIMKVSLKFEKNPDLELPRGLEEAYLRGELSIKRNIRFVRVYETNAEIEVWIDSIDPSTTTEVLYDVIEATEDAIESANDDMICGGEQTRASITLFRPYSKLLSLLYRYELSKLNKLYRTDAGMCKLSVNGHPQLRADTGWGERSVTGRLDQGKFKEATTTIMHAFTDTTLYPGRINDKTTDDILEIWIESDERLQYEIPLRNFSLAEYSDSIEFDEIGGNLAQQTLSQNDLLPDFSSVLTVRYVCVIESRIVTFADFDNIDNSMMYRISWGKQERDSDLELTIRQVVNLNLDENQRAKLAVVWRDD